MNLPLDGAFSFALILSRFWGATSDVFVGAIDFLPLVLNTAMNLTDFAPLVLIGAGNMGGAMLKGWIDRGLPGDQVQVVDPAPNETIQDFCKAHGIALVPAADALPGPAGLLLLAVKPQLMTTLLPELKGLTRPGGLIISIAAGTTLATLEAALGSAGSLVRVMPNTPAQVGRSISVAVSNKALTPRDREVLTTLLQAIGGVAFVDDEAHMDAVTALSGSGPAYVFHLVEAMTAAGIAAGLSPDLADILARQTIAGAGELVHQSTLPASLLREQVTSPGGTTAAGLDILMDASQGLTPLMTKTVAAAKKRSQELGKA